MRLLTFMLVVLVGVFSAGITGESVLAKPGITKLPKRSGAIKLGEAYRHFEKGDFTLALETSEGLRPEALRNPEILLFLRGQSQYITGDYQGAGTSFAFLAKSPSHYQDFAKFRLADTLWAQKKTSKAVAAYERILSDSKLSGSGDGELAIARFRIAQAAESNQPAKAITLYEEFLNKHPAHELEELVDASLKRLGHGGISGLSLRERIKRGQDLISAKKWEIALAELAQLERGKMDARTKLDHTFWLSMSLFKRRRHYEKAGRNFLSIYKQMGSRSAEALFHGARALSRADFDIEAIGYYQLLVKEYPNSKWAPEAQFLSGWLEFNMGKFRKALPYLETLEKKYGSSKFAKESPWYRGMSYFLLGEHGKALPLFRKVAKAGGKEIGGKGRYWTARAQEELKQIDDAHKEYRSLVGDYPFSWYALLSRTRLLRAKKEIGIFGDSPRDLKKSPAFATKFDGSFAKDALLLKAEELLTANLKAQASEVLRRGERRFLDRHKRKRPEAMAALLDAYKRADNFNRPWMLAVVHGGRRALDATPTGSNRNWWQHAYPLAYKDLVEKYRVLSGFPDYYLYTIMRKESGFAPNTHSYADAQGLLQMIPPTTVRVVRALGMEYTEDFLFDPESNIKSGAWYIGRLLKKFGNQIPIGAGSFNSGPKAVMRWLDRNGTRPIDVFVELVSYRQTRKYMKRTTETYARYKYLYDKEIYQQPLGLNPKYLIDEITY